MKLYIKIENGQPVGHPITAENYKQCFPEHNVDDIPDGYAEFVRVPKPSYGPYECCAEYSTYVWDNNIVKDHWDIRPLTDKEKNQSMEFHKSRWIEIGGTERHPSWIFNEETCSYVPPIPLPSDANTLPQNRFYDWDDESNNWVIKSNDNDIPFAPEWPRTAPF